MLCYFYQEAEARGENYDRVKLLETTAEEADKFERKRKKKNPDEGFSGTFIQFYRVVVKRRLPAKFAGVNPRRLLAGF